MLVRVNKMPRKPRNGYLLLEGDASDISQHEVLLAREYGASLMFSLILKRYMIRNQSDSNVMTRLQCLEKG